MKIIYITISLLFMSVVVWGQEWIEVQGKVMRSQDKQPIESARVWSEQAIGSVITDEEGNFTIQVKSKNAILLFERDGYFSKEIKLNGRKNIKIYLINDDIPVFSSTQNLPLGIVNYYDHTGSSVSRTLQNLNEGKPFVDEALYGSIPGLQVIEKSGMPGEGAYINLRGVRSFVATNTPLIVVDGLPYLPDTEVSPLISGYSRDIFMPIPLKDIKSITFARGADVAMYGSMGSNGVIMIETEKGTDMQTKIEFQTVNGITWMDKRYPMMNADNFKRYLVDVSETKVTNTNELVALFPFLKDDYDYNYYYKHIYGYDTDWQEEIYNNAAFTTENILKIKGGDEVAKYNLTAGYLLNNGVVKNTDLAKYYIRLNADMNISAKVSIAAAIGFSYTQSNLQEQGIIPQTNPLIAALYKAPVLGVWERDMYGNRVSRYDTVRQFGISNPSAIVNEIEAKAKAYDILGNISLNYRPISKINISAMLGIYYNYNSQNFFVPGKTRPTIAPLMEGYAANTVRAGSGLGYNIYTKVQGDYTNTFSDLHTFSAVVGYQLMNSKQEFDYAEAVNTTSDFYKTLDNSQSDYGKNIDGYEDIWNWMNAYTQLSYDYRKWMKISASLAADAASSTGKNAVRLRWLPSVNLSVNLKNMLFLQDVALLDELLVRGTWATLANSRYSSIYSQSYYVNQPFNNIVGMVKENIPNSLLKPEKVQNFNVGLDFALFGRKLSLSADYYKEITSDMLLARDMPSVYGFRRMFDNSGKIETEAIEGAFNAFLIQNKNFEWYVGGNITHYKSTVKKLGGRESIITSFSDDSQLITKVGEKPYVFYGTKTKGVFSTSEEAQTANLTSYNGYKFSAGDIHFEDNGDGIIDDNDRHALGSAAPDFFGGFYTGFRYQGWGLSAHFTYSYGNKIYNVVRRKLESMDKYYNQTQTVERRWNNYGDQTNIPRAHYDDPAGNGRFSDRWVEDGSYLKIKNITLSYVFPKELSFIRQLEIYMSGENLATFTKYLGLDPEFSWSYSPELQGIDQGKIPAGTTVRLGVKMNF